MATFRSSIQKALRHAESIRDARNRERAEQLEQELEQLKKELDERRDDAGFWRQVAAFFGADAGAHCDAVEDVAEGLLQAVPCWSEPCHDIEVGLRWRSGRGIFFRAEPETGAVAWQVAATLPKDGEWIEVSRTDLEEPRRFIENRIVDFIRQG